MAPYQKVLCPYDFSDTARAALRAALGLAERFGAKLALVHVVEPVAIPDYPFVLRIDEEQLRRRLEGDARKSLPAGPGPALELLIRSGIAPAFSTWIDSQRPSGWRSRNPWRRSRRAAWGVVTIGTERSRRSAAIRSK